MLSASPLSTHAKLHASIELWHQHGIITTENRVFFRPTIANQRLKCNGTGQVVLQLKSSYKDSTRHIVMSRLKLMQRLFALVPRARLQLIRFHGVLAPDAKLRSEFIPSPAEHATEPSTDHAQAPDAPARMC